jgi:hypothetical protein
MLPVTDQRKKKPMNNTAPYDHMPAGYAEDRPFRMSETASIALTEIEERTDSLPLIPMTPTVSISLETVFLAVYAWHCRFQLCCGC